MGHRGVTFLAPQSLGMGWGGSLGGVAFGGTFTRGQRAMLLAGTSEPRPTSLPGSSELPHTMVALAGADCSWLLRLQAPCPRGRAGILEASEVTSVSSATCCWFRCFTNVPRSKGWGHRPPSMGGVSENFEASSSAPGGGPGRAAPGPAQRTVTVLGL